MDIGITKIKSKEVILIKITSFFWIISKVISWKLWLSDRVFPILPPFEITPNLPNQVHLLLLVTSIVGLVLVFLFSQNYALLILVILSEIASCFLDQMRWQPWEYQYLLMFVFFVFCKSNTKQLQQLLVFLIAVTYIYSGLHKLNGGFLYNIWEQRILRNLFHFSNATISNPLVHYSGLLLGVIETTIGVGLLLFKNKKIFASLAIAMHLSILLFLIISNINPVVWPWNMAFIIYLGLLFFDNDEINFNLNFFKNKFNLAITLLIGFVPFLSFFGLYPNFLAFNIYSGNIKKLVICVKDTKQHPELKPYISASDNEKYCQKMFSIYPNQWAFKELNVPICPDDNVLNKFKEVWDISFPNTESTFIIYQYPYKKEDIVEIQ